MYPMPPSFVKLSPRASEFKIGSGIFTPSKDQVPDEIYKELMGISTPSTALAVSCVATSTALAEVFTQMNSQVVLATEHVLGRALQQDDQDRLVGDALAGIGR